jgi:hypothetical protein
MNNTIHHNKNTYGLNNTFEKVVKHFDTPLEKFKTVVALTLIFSLIYFVLFTIDNNHFEITEDKVSGNGYFTFLWLSSTVNFTVPMGDVYPLTVTAKILFIIHISMFWFVMLA